MNIITVTWKQDLHNLLYQAYSLEKNWQGLKEWIIVSEDGDVTYKFIIDRIVPIMTGWSVSVLHAPVMSAKVGWWRQQVCKFWAAANMSSQDYSLILDSKNFLIKPINGKWFIGDDGITKIRQWQKEWGLADHYIQTCNYFGVPPERKTFAWVQTPWVWRKDIVKIVIEEFRKRGSNIYQEEILPSWEFNAYWFFAQNMIPWKNVEQFGEGIFYYEGNPSPEYALSKIKSNYEEHPFWTFHRLMAQHPECVKFNNDLLLKCNIINDDLIGEWKNIYDKHRGN